MRYLDFHIVVVQVGLGDPKCSRPRNEWNPRMHTQISRVFRARYTGYLSDEPVSLSLSQSMSSERTHGTSSRVQIFQEHLECSYDRMRCYRLAPSSQHQSGAPFHRRIAGDSRKNWAQPEGRSPLPSCSQLITFQRLYFVALSGIPSLFTSLTLAAFHLSACPGSRFRSACVSSYIPHPHTGRSDITGAKYLRFMQFQVTNKYTRMNVYVYRYLPNKFTTPP
ncbi:hypothetical protein F5I97DRAFT_1513506 [Phlebopus sp. FC_14]|nr:hypothetical protein F5I97DRAFT_1513506 [Phlebopus sp. FC_14]